MALSRYKPSIFLEGLKENIKISVKIVKRLR